MLIAITRGISPSMDHCELTHLQRNPIDIESARRQHRRYEECLADLGCEIHRLPPGADLPDSVFVEDTAVVLDELAVIARPGAESRREETKEVAKALDRYRILHRIESPGTLDGGDVLKIGKKLFVGLSGRTNEEGIDQLSRLLMPYGYEVESVAVKDCLHLKSAATLVGQDKLLLNGTRVDEDKFRGCLIGVDPSEPSAGNALLVGETVVYPSAYPATRRKMEDLGIAVRTVDVSELAKAEGGVTCCSLLFENL